MIIVLYMLKKFKVLFDNDGVFFSTVIILVGVISFGLGQKSLVSENLQKQSDNKLQAGIVFIDNAFSAVATSTTFVSSSGKDIDLKVVKNKKENNGSLKIVASRSGTKYHLITCSGAKRIKEKNKIFFSSETEAEAAGYEPAANCPELHK